MVLQDSAVFWPIGVQALYHDAAAEHKHKSFFQSVAEKQQQLTLVTSLYMSRLS